MVNLTEAFPRTLRDTAQAAVTVLTPALTSNYYELEEERQIINVCGDNVWLPRRLHDKGYRDHIYYDASPFQAFETMADARGLSPLQKLIFFCLLTRHHNGFVREAALKRIIIVNEPWVVPYVVQLASEYVYEILVVVRQNLNELNSTLYGEFLRNNPAYFSKVKQRITSYWNAYYRWHDYAGPHERVQHFWREGYIGHDISDRFNAIASRVQSEKDASL